MPELVKTPAAMQDMAAGHQSRLLDGFCQLSPVQSRAQSVSLAELSPVRPRCFVGSSVAQRAGWSSRPVNPLCIEGWSKPRKKPLRLRHRLNVSASDGGAGNSSQSNRLPEQDGVSPSEASYQNSDDIDTLRTGISAAEQKAHLLEKAQTETLKALAAAETKARQYSATMMENSEKAFAEVEATKLAFNTKLEAAVEGMSALEAELKISKLEAIDLALKVEKIAERAVQEATSQSAEDSRVKLAAAETFAADASLQIEERIRRAADEAASSVLAEANAAIQEATEASEKARQNAQRAEAALLKRLSVLDILATSEATIASLREATFVLEQNLKIKENEAERLRVELEAVVARALSAETRLSAAEKAIEDLKKAGETAASKREESTNQALEALKTASAEREQATLSVFRGEIEALQRAALVARKADKVQEQAFLRRCAALEKSLKAAESSAEAWRARALAIEALSGKRREEAGENVHSTSNADMLSAGRINTSLGNDSRKWDLLANGPRKETPEWMKRRIESGLQGLPPRETKPIDAFVEAEIPLHLPTPEEVWSIANAKIKTDDLFAKQVAEKEALDTQKKALDSQRKALERALKKGSRRLKSPEEADIKLEPGTGSGREVVFQGFNWESWRRKWYLELAPRAADLAHSGITAIWLPPPTDSVSPQGYMPGDLYNLNSAYGTQDELKLCIEEMHNNDILVLGDVVLNHRCAQKQNEEGIWNMFGGKLAWGPEAIVKDDPNFRGQGNPSTGDFFHAAPNIDHSQPFVQRDITEWMNWLRTDIGYDGWRLDFVRGFWGGYVKDYIEATNPVFAIGEYWDSLGYEGGNVCYNQDPHRQRIINWINATGGSSSAFDVTTKGILHAALHNEYWRLIDPQGKPPGVVGWWPSRAVTFLENHDTGSTQGHWPFPRDKLMQGYAYILTHPGTPVIFYDHFYDFGLHDSIAELIAARTKTGVHCRSTIKILHANMDGYVAQVGDNLVMKLGRYDWNPSKQDNLVGSWERLIDKGSDYQLWQRT